MTSGIRTRFCWAGSGPKRDPMHRAPSASANLLWRRFLTPVYCLGFGYWTSCLLRSFMRKLLRFPFIELQEKKAKMRGIRCALLYALPRKSRALPGAIGRRQTMRTFLTCRTSPSQRPIDFLCASEIASHCRAFSSSSCLSESTSFLEEFSSADAPRN